MTVGEHLHVIRTQKKLSRRKLAELCGVSESAIKQYETGKRQPRIEQLGKIAQALGVQIGEFLIEGIYLDDDEGGFGGGSGAGAGYADGTGYGGPATPDDDPRKNKTSENDIVKLIDAYKNGEPLLLDGEELTDQEAKLFIDAIKASVEFVKASKKRRSEIE